tara:strand:- start:911 stop:1645 length:735 start_codon:yes stop_codon:yes gene_type:complete
MKQSPKSPDYSGLKELINNEIGLPTYNKSIVNIFIEELNGEKCVVDFGAGIGILANIYEKKTGIKPICVEIDKENRKFLLERGFKFYDNISEIGSAVDGVFSSNVMEHIEDDLEVLRNIKKYMKTGSKLVLYLPAFPILYSDLDKAVGHYRRYTKKDISDKLRKAGFLIEKIYFADSIGFFASLAVKILGCKSVDVLGNLKTLKFYDSVIFPISKVFDTIGLQYLFGKNIVIIAKTPQSYCERG